MTLEDFMETATNSDRILIEDNRGNELYRGFVGCLKYQDIEWGRKVKEHYIASEIYTAKTMKRGISVWKEPDESVPKENTSLHKYSDLIEMVFTKIILGD